MKKITLLLVGITVTSCGNNEVNLKDNQESASQTQGLTQSLDEVAKNLFKVADIFKGFKKFYSDEAIDSLLWGGRLVKDSTITNGDEVFQLGADLDMVLSYTRNRSYLTKQKLNNITDVEKRLGEIDQISNFPETLFIKKGDIEYKLLLEDAEMNARGINPDGSPIVEVFYQSDDGILVVINPAQIDTDVTELSRADVVIKKIDNFPQASFMTVVKDDYRNKFEILASDGYPVSFSIGYVMDLIKNSDDEGWKTVKKAINAGETKEEVIKALENIGVNRINISHKESQPLLDFIDYMRKSS